MMNRRILYFLIFLISSCSTGRSLNWNPDDYTVRSGDTLYSIAWRYELDPQNLAKWNDLQSPYVIRPGQRIHTKKPKNFAVKQQQTSGQTTTSQAVRYKPVVKPKIVIVKKGDTVYGIAKKNNVQIGQLVAWNSLKKPYTLSINQVLKLSKPRTVVTTTQVIKPGGLPSTNSTTAYPSGPVVWQWPVTGSLLKKFNRKKTTTKGIEISGNKGNSVKAAAAGRVVYSGSGLISYGNLLIIKHNKTFLSAYAYNRKLLVKEGDLVKKGQTIAEVGSYGNKSPRLHFEIRKNGKPVNPLYYLPKG